MNPYNALTEWFEHYEACSACRSATSPLGGCGLGGGELGGGPLRHRALAAVERIAWPRPTQAGEHSFADMTVSEKAYLELPSETKLDIEFVMYGMKHEPGSFEKTRRSLRTIATLAHSHGVESGLEKMTNILTETMHRARQGLPTPIRFATVPSGVEPEMLTLLKRYRHDCECQLKKDLNGECRWCRRVTEIATGSSPRPETEEGEDSQ
jgi:hypothetical protein